MKIEQLELRAVGKFSNTNIDFSQGNHGLHIIFGNNEAGKSTSLQAITDWLFGFPRFGNDGFRHGNPNVRVAGVLSDEHGNKLGLTRRRGNANTLRDFEDREIVPEASLQSFLKGINRDFFCQMFGINQVELRKGGEALSQSQGQLGESLFAGASGITTLSRILSDFDKRVKELFVSRSTGGELGKILTEYREKELALRNDIVTVGKWEHWQTALSEAQKEKARLENVCQCLRSKFQQLERVRTNIEAVNSWCQVSKELESFKDVKILDDCFGDESRDLERQIHDSDIEIKRIEQELNTLEVTLASLAEPKKLKIFLDRLKKLSDQESVYLSNIGQLTLLNEKQHRLNAEIQTVYSDLQRTSEDLPQSSLNSGLRRKGSVLQLMKQRKELEQSLAKSKLLHESKTTDLHAIVSRIAELKVAPNLLGLRTQFRLIAADNPGPSLRQLKETIAQEKTNYRLRKLQIWPEEITIEQLKDPDIPSKESIEASIEEERERRDRKRQVENAIKKEEEKLNKFKVHLRHLEQDWIVPTLQDLTFQRQVRDGAWELVKKRWITLSPDEQAEQSVRTQVPLDECNSSQIEEIYEFLCQSSDRISDQLRDDAERVAEKLQRLREIDFSENQLANLNAELKHCDEDIQRWYAEWERTWNQFGVKAKSPKEMLEWVVCKNELLRLNAKIQAWEEDENVLQAKSLKLRNQLQQLLLDSEIGQDLSGLELADLLAMTEEFLDAQSKIEQSFSDYEASKRGVEDAIRIASQAIGSDEQKIEDWKEEWAKEMSLLSLPADTSCDEVEAVMVGYESLRKVLEEMESVERDQKRMRCENQEFLRSLSLLQKDFLIDLQIEDEVKTPSEILSLMEKMAGEDRRLEDERCKLEERIATCRNALAQKKIESEGFQTRLDELLLRSGKSSIEELPQAALDSQRKKVAQGQFDSFNRSLREHAPGGDVEAFVRVVLDAAKDRVILEQEIASTKTELIEHERKLDEVKRQHQEAEFHLNQLREKDSSTQLSLDCELLASDIEEKFRELAVARICSSVIREGIERFRSENQAPILQTASQYFSEMTVGGFSELQTDWADETPVLVGVRTEGREKLTVDKMSDGTKDQLYLALRLASIQEWLEKHPPIPFVVDDILIHFDDDRARATLRSLASLSNRTQVIFFTHHSHLIDLASDSVPSGQLFVHHL